MHSDGDAAIDSDSGSDAFVEDAPPLRPDASGLCMIDDSFAGTGAACGTWGTETGMDMLRAGDKLFATPTTTSLTASCTTLPLIPSGTITIHLDVLGNTANNNYALFNLTTASGSLTLNIYREDNIDKVNAMCDVPLTGQAYSADTHRYLRYAMTPVGDDLSVKLLSSATTANNTFTNEIAACMFTGGALGSVSLTFGSAIDQDAATGPSSQWGELHYSCQ